MILSELTNWQENRTAVLECSNDCIYLYSYPHEEDQDLKTLWVANTKKRDTLENGIKSDMENGDQPYMPIKFCNQNAYISEYENEEDWKLQWGLDQNSIAVYYKNSLIAVMPEWSGIKEFSGYSSGVSAETAMAWPLLPDNEQITRFVSESEFLDSWNDDTWPQFQSRVLSIYGQFMPGSNRYFAADGGKWPPLGLICNSSDDTQFWATVGMSLLPMPVFGMTYEDPEMYRRIELAMLINNNIDTMPLGSYLAAQARYPWLYGTHFDHGHTIPCQQLKEIGSGMAYMLIIDKASFLPEMDSSVFRDSATRLLFMVPIYKSEQEFAENSGSAALLQKMEQSGLDMLNLDRAAIM